MLSTGLHLYAGALIGLKNWLMALLHVSRFKMIGTAIMDAAHRKVGMKINIHK